MFARTIRTSGLPARPTTRRTARRLTSALAATALATGPAVLLGAAPAHAAAPATGPAAKGTADAAVLRAALDVGLLDRTVDVPLTTALNEVHAPAKAAKTALTVKVDGVDGDRPFSVLRADAATAEAGADGRRAEARTELAAARVHLPGLPLLSLIEVGQVASEAVCVRGERPRAESNVLGDVRVLGRKVTLSAGGTTKVAVPGVGTVALALSAERTTARTAAAAALDLDVRVDPLDLNVAEVTGRVTLAEASCTTPRGDGHDGGGTGGSGTGGGSGSGGSDGGSGTGGGSGGSGSGGSTGGPGDGGGTGGSGTAGGSSDHGGDAGGPAPAGDRGARVGAGTGSLAETGGSTATPYLAGGAVALLVAGGGAVTLARLRRDGGPGGRPRG